MTTKSSWKNLPILTVVGKTTTPNNVVTFTASGHLFQIDLSWSFDTAAGYSLVEIWGSPTGSDRTTAVKLSEISYPTTKWSHIGLGTGVQVWYWIRTKDKYGNYSDWSNVVTATSSSDASELKTLLDGQLDESQLVAALRDKIDSGAGANDAILQQQTTIDGLSAQYTVKIQADGYVTGYGLATTTNNGIPSSEFVVLANKFAVATPGITRKYPFVVGTVNGQTTIGIDGTLVVDGSIVAQKIDARGLSIKDAQGNVILSAGVPLDYSTYLKNKPTSLSGINTTEGSKLSGVATGATKNLVTFSATAPASPGNGDIWVDTSVTPNITKVRVSGAWQISANYTTATSQLTDDAGLGNTANYELIRNKGGFLETFESGDTSQWQNYSGAGEVSIVTVADSQTGGKVLRVGNNSGDDQAWLLHKTLIPFDPSATYRVKVRARCLLGSGKFHCGVAGVAADGSTLVNRDGTASYASQHYAAANAATPGTEWIEYVGYIKGVAATGTGVNSPNIETPSVLHQNVRYLRPLLVLNFTAQPGQTEVDFVSIENLTQAITWGGVSGTGKPADGATSDLKLIARGGCTVVGNTAEKSSGTNAWDSDVYSLDSYTGGAFVSAVPAQTDKYVMFGLNADPTTDQGYTSLDYSWYCLNTGSLRIYESGVNVGTFGTYTTSDVLAIVYDGVNVRYMQNGTVIRTVAALANLNLFFDSSFNSVGSKLTNIRFGPVSSNDWGAIGSSVSSRFIGNELVGNTATAVITDSGTYPKATLTDADLAIGSTYATIGGAGAHWVQADLGAVQFLSQSYTYWYAQDGRTYSYAIAISEDGTAWNWVVGSGSTAGVVSSYVQSRAPINGYYSIGVRLPTIDGINAFARYVRIYCNGNTVNTSNHMYQWQLWSGGAPVDPYTQDYNANLTPGATRNDIVYSATAPSSPIDGMLWMDTSVTPNVLKIRESGTWRVASNYTTNTNQLTDGANLGGTATWSGVSGTGKPENNATNSRIFVQDTLPSNPGVNDLWKNSLSIQPTKDFRFDLGEIDSSLTLVRNSIATYFDADGIRRTVQAGEPRFAYGPVTRKRLGIILEPPHTNYLKYSMDLSNAVWSKANCTISNAIGPDGTSVPCCVTRTAQGNHYVAQTYTTTSHANTTYTFSAMIKAGTMTGQLRVWIKDGAGNTLGTTTVTPPAKWTRYWFTGTFGASPSANIQCVIDPNDDVGVAGDTFYVSDLQLEQGLLTSFIPTTSVAANRDYEYLEATGANFAWVNASEGTFVTEHNYVDTGSTNSTARYAYSVHMFGPTAGQDDLYIRAFSLSETVAEFDAWGRTAGVSQFDAIGVSGIAPNTFVRQVLGYKTNDVAHAVEAGAIYTDTSVTLPAFTTFRVGDTAQSLSSVVKRVTYYGTKLSNNQIQALSARVDPGSIGSWNGTQWVVASDVDAALGAASVAKNAANVAQTTANTANQSIADIISDSLLTADEKPSVIAQRDQIVAEQSGIDTQATTFGITTEKTTYDNAVTALTTYLATLTTPVLWSDLGGSTTIVGATFRTKFNDVYAARQALLNKIADEAGKRATWATISGTGKPADGATKNTIYRQATAPTSPVNGDIWVDTSVTPNITKVRVSGAWQISANYTTNTNQLTDGANLGSTATWGGVSGIPYDTIFSNDDSTALGFNPTFSAWTGAVPDGYALINQSGTMTVSKETTIKRIGQQSVKMVVPVGATGYHHLKKVCDLSTTPLPLGTFASGTIDIYIGTYTSGGKPGLKFRLFTDAAQTTYVDTDVPANTSIVGAWQRLPFTARVPAGQTIYAIGVYHMASVPDGAFGGANFIGTVYFDNFRFALFDSSVDNTTIALAANGQLSGAGGGQVTITGLGYSGALNATKNTIYRQATAPTSPSDGDIWVDTSVTPNVQKVRVSGAWQNAATVGATFETGQAGSIQGQITPGNASTYIADASIGTLQIGGFNAQTGTLTINTEQMQLDAQGNATFSGALSGATGVFSGTLAAGVIDFSSMSGTSTVYTPGTYTITVPNNPSWTSVSMRVTLQGGGGGGAGGDVVAVAGSSRIIGGGGGGEGGEQPAVVTYSGLTPGTTYTLEVGTGGAGGGARSNGQTGGTTRFLNSSGTPLVTALGGHGGHIPTSTTSAGAGGSGTAGVDGGPGQLGDSQTFEQRALGGTGGSSRYAGTTAPSGVAGGIGAGGSGGYCNVDGTEQSGGRGGNGQALIEFFDPNVVILHSTYSNLVAWLDTVGQAAIGQNVPSNAR